MPTYIHERFRTLIVDDDPVSRSFLRDYLGDISDCVESKTGQEAVDAFEAALSTDPFGLICLDTFLPDFSGREVLQRVRDIELRAGIEKDESTIVVMTTAASDIKDVLKAMNKGCDGYIKKPFTQEQLFTELNRVGIEFSWDPT
ncbi:MAG: response regulator [Bdellovibrionales bacterium]|nr:response regulator [Bdellovibrionales bacterium]